MLEVADCRFCEWLAEDGHAVLPFGFTDHREPLDVGEVFDAELEVLPCRSGLPTVEIAHVEQQAQLSVLADELLERGHETFVVYFFQFAADVNGEHLAAVFFIKLKFLPKEAGLTQ